MYCNSKINIDKSPPGANVNSLLKAVIQFEYFFVIYLLHEIFNVRGSLSKALQEIELDVISAQNLIESTMKVLENFSNVDKFDKGHGGIFLTKFFLRQVMIIIYIWIVLDVLYTNI